MPQLLSPCAVPTEAHVPRAHAPQPQWEASTPHLESSPRSLQLEKGSHTAVKTQHSQKEWKNNTLQKRKESTVKKTISLVAWTMKIKKVTKALTTIANHHPTRTWHLPLTTMLGLESHRRSLSRSSVDRVGLAKCALAKELTESGRAGRDPRARAERQQEQQGEEVIPRWKRHSPVLQVVLAAGWAWLKLGSQVHPQGTHPRSLQRCRFLAPCHRPL